MTTAFKPKSDFLNLLIERGFVQDATDYEGLDETLRGGATPAYIGFDCTAPSLHVGSLVQIMMLRWLQKTGHKPIVLMGGGTTKVGDPSGKDEARKILDAGGHRRQSSPESAPYSTNTSAFGEGPTGAAMHGQQRRLAEGSQLHRVPARLWPPFLHQPHADLRQREACGWTASSRCTFLEFNYMLLQAYDFLELNRRYGCRLQMGGSDQWGNIVNGIDLTRRVAQRGGVRPHHPAAHHRRRQEDGQDRPGRGVAERGHAVAL